MIDTNKPELGPQHDEIKLTGGYAVVKEEVPAVDDMLILETAPT